VHPGISRLLLCGLGLVGCTGVVSVPFVGDSGGPGGEVRTDGGPLATPDASAPPDAGQNAFADAGGAPVDAGFECPTHPPFDETDATLVQRCTQPVFVAVGGLNRRAVSNDGVSWRVTQLSPAEVAQVDNHDLLVETTVKVRDGLILAAGGNGLFVSDDGGKTFVLSDAPHDGFNLYGPCVDRLGATFSLAATDGTWQSSNGHAWAGSMGDQFLPGTSTFAADGKVTAGFSKHCGGAVRGNGRVVFVNDDLRVRTFDGTTWFETKLGPQSGRAGGVAFGMGRFVAVFETEVGDRIGLRAVSADGLTWAVTTNATPGALSFGAGVDDVTWDGQQFIAVGASQFLSPDGEHWTERSGSRGFSAIAVKDGVWVGVARSGLFRSLDGTTWVETLPANNDVAQDFWVIASGHVLK
jgi:hypothetical protein